MIAGQKYCRMLQEEHSAILLTSIKLPIVIKIFVSSFFEWPFYTGFPVCDKYEILVKWLVYFTRLHWMFVISGALLPSIYLSETFGTVDDRRLQVFGRLEEALRVRENNSRTVIVPYTRFRYRDTLNFYQLVSFRVFIMAKYRHVFQSQKQKFIRIFDHIQVRGAYQRCNTG